MVNSRRKGNSAERDICKMLQNTLGGKFERRSMGMPGADIICPDWFHYVPEVKHDKSIKCKHFWKPSKLLTSYWKQAEHQAEGTGKLPLLFIKVEGEWYAIIEEGISLKVGVFARVAVGDSSLTVRPIESFISILKANYEAVPTL